MDTGQLWACEEVIFENLDGIKKANKSIIDDLI